MRKENKSIEIKSNKQILYNDLVNFEELFYYCHKFFQKIVVKDVENDNDDDESVNEGDDDASSDSDDEIDKLCECLK